MKVKCDHRSKFSNLSNWKEEAGIAEVMGSNPVEALILFSTLISTLIIQLMNSTDYYLNKQLVQYVSSCLEMRDNLLSKA